MSEAPSKTGSQADSAAPWRWRRAVGLTLSRWRNSLRGMARPVGHVLASLLGAWLCARFIRQLEWACVVRDLRHAGPRAAVLVLAPVVGNFVHMLGWRRLLPVTARPRLARAFAIFLSAQAGNEVGSGVLGESFKISLFPAQQRGAALRAMVLDNLTALLALLALVLTIGSVLAQQLVERFVPLPVAFGALGLTLLAGAVVARRALAAPDALNVYWAFLAHLLGKLWIIADFALWLWLLAVPSWYSSALLGLVSTAASVLAAPIPGQLGVMEAALSGSAAWAGITVGTLLSIAALRRVRGLMWVALGGLLLLQLTRAARRCAPA